MICARNGISRNFRPELCSGLLPADPKALRGRSLEGELEGGHYADA